MKTRTAVPSALAISIILATIVAAQETVTKSGDEGQATTQTATQASEPEYERGKPAAAASSESPPLPVAEAKKRYLATQQRLQNLIQGGSPQSLRVEVRQQGNDAEIAFHQPRDRLRKAVAEDFDARRQLQQAELAALENRIARIKRALEIRDAMRDTLIDQRTDALLEQLEEEGKLDESPQGGGGPAARGTKSAGGAPPAKSTASVQEKAQILKRAIDEAKSSFESAERDYERALRLFKSGAISSEVLAEEENKQKSAKLVHDRRVLGLATFLEEHRSALHETKEPAHGDGAVADQPLAERLTQLDLKEAVVLAEANLAAAKNLYNYSKKMHAKGYVTEGDVESKASQMERARFQLERANLKLDAFLEAHPDLPTAKEPASGDSTVNEPTKTLDQNAIAGSPVDDGALVDDHSALTALESDVAEAKAKRESAEREYNRFEKMRASGAIEQALLDEKTEECKQAQIQLERKELIRNRFVLTHPAGATDKPPADGDVGVSELNRQLAALNVQEAESNLAEQQIRCDRYERLLATKAIEPRLFDEAAEKHKLAQIQLERAKAKLEAFDQPPADDRAFEKEAKTSPDETGIE